MSNFRDMPKGERQYFTRITGRLSEMEFSNFEIQKGSEAAFIAARKFAFLDEQLKDIWSDEAENNFTQDADYESYLNSNKLDSHFLTLFGECGTGKTHLGISALSVRGTNQGIPYEYWQVADLLNTLRTASEAEKHGKEIDRHPSFSAYSADPSYSGIIKRLCGEKYGSHALLLDDIGVEKYSAWALEILQLIVDKRYIDDELPTIFTTNNLDNLPPRILSRLKSGVVVPIVGRDYRVQQGKLVTLKAIHNKNTKVEV